MIRIAKFISTSGYCSRRDAEKLISEQKVTVNNIVITTPAMNVSEEDIVAIDGKVIKCEDEKERLWAYYKPAGIITTHRDPQGRPTVFEQFQDLPRVVSIGRLDLNSEGLLLLTNSGRLARELELPKNKTERIYKVRAYSQHNINPYDLEKITDTQITIDGIIYNPKSITLINTGSKNQWYMVVLTEGKNREIRKIFAHFGYTVNRLIRVQYGKYMLGKMKPGEYKEIKIT
jgi:23S rRNA pseudouridine2605 synthase